MTAVRSSDGHVVLDPADAELAAQACRAWATAITATLTRSGIGLSGLAREDMRDHIAQLERLAFELDPPAPSDFPMPVEI